MIVNWCFFLYNKNVLYGRLLLCYYVSPWYSMLLCPGICILRDTRTWHLVMNFLNMFFYVVFFCSSACTSWCSSCLWNASRIFSCFSRDLDCYGWSCWTILPSKQDYCRHLEQIRNIYDVVVGLWPTYLCCFMGIFLWNRINVYVFTKPYVALAIFKVPLCSQERFVLTLYF